MPGPPPVYLDDRDSDLQTYLWNTQENAAKRMVKPRVDALPSKSADQAVLTGIEQEETVSVNGTASGIRISNHADYDDDPLVALCEWAGLLLAHVNGQQGEGWNLTNEFTGRAKRGIIEKVTMIRREGAKYEVEWSLTFRFGRGTMPASPPSIPDVNPTTAPTFGGQELHEIKSLQVTKAQKVSIARYAFSDPTRNGVVAQSGARRDVQIRGSVTGDESVRSEFDAVYRDTAGSDETLEYSSSFPGSTIEAMLMEYEPTRTAGVTQRGEYNMHLIEGIP